MQSSYGEDEDSADDGWEELETIQDFDGFDDDDDNQHDHIPRFREFRNMVIPGGGGALRTGPFYEAGSAPSAGASATQVSILVSSLVSALCSFLEKDKGRSDSLYQVICGNLENLRLIDDAWAKSEFDIVRSSYSNSLLQLVSLAKEQDLRDPAHPDSLIIPLSTDMSWSRYRREFEEMQFIAGGGFGKVYRARHKLDRNVYAVKKIRIKAKTINDLSSHLSEVHTLASLNHVNIVPYKNAWLEPYMAGVGEDDDLDLAEDEEEEEDSEGEEDGSMGVLPKGVLSNKDGESSLFQKGSSPNKNSLLKKPNSSPNKKFSLREETSSQSIVFQRSNGGAGSGENVWSSSSHVSSTATSMEMSMDQSGEGISAKAVVQYNSLRKRRHEVNYNNQVAEIHPHLKLEWATLYIQMTECQLTLRAWLDDRNRNDNFSDFYQRFLSSGGGDIATDCTHRDVEEEIFAQLISGLGYIHGAKIVHHDIKPSNVFVSVDQHRPRSHILVQLGDFGLACPLEQKHSNKVVGTPLYAAPEQLSGACDKKSDIYSLGVILVELLVPCTTDMERINRIKDAKGGVFAEVIPEAYRELIKRLLDKCADRRPTALDLGRLFAKMRSSRDPVVDELQRKLTTQDERIAGLTQSLEHAVRSRDDELAKKAEEIARLEQELAKKAAQSEKSQNYIHIKHKENKRLKKKLDQQTSCSSSSETGG